MGRLIDEKDLIELYDEDVKLWWGIVLEDIQDLPTVEAIPKAEYEARLKADMAAILTELQLEIEENSYSENVYGDEYSINKVISTDDIYQIIQQKIDKYKAESGDNK